jgi:hypothetical protein
MTRLTKDYNFGFIGDHTNVYTIVRRPLPRITKNVYTPKLTVNPLRYMYFTEPFESKFGHNKENVLLGFMYKQNCRLWLKRMMIDNIKSQTPPPYSDMYDERMTIRTHRLYELKSISNALHLPIVVLLDNNKTQHELFYYRYMKNNK